MKVLYRFLKSVRLAIVLILVLCVLSLLSTLVPQGADDEFYRAGYAPAVSWLITALDVNRFFTSALFFALVAAFAVNLGVCAVDRFVRRLRGKSPPRYGPDIVHLGLLLLLAGGLVTGLSRQEKDLRLGEGDVVQVTPDTTLRLVSFQTMRYGDGSPRSWISTVDVLRKDSPQAATFPIRVNHPLRLRGVSVYQASWGREDTLVFRDAAGAEVKAVDGEGFQDGQSFWYFAHIVQDADGPRALFQELQGSRLVSTRRLAAGQSVGPLTLLRMGSREVSGLRVANDPGWLPVLAALLVVAAGLALTFIQKRGSDKD